MTKTNKVAGVLNRIAQTTYGEQYRDHCLELYLAYVASAEKISARRAQANAFFLSLNTIIATALAVAIKNEASTAGFFGALSKKETNSTVWIPIVIGIMVCVIWYNLIKSYKNMNTAKFAVIHEIEKLLPIACYDAEWEAVGRGADAKKYVQFTKIELWVPIILAAFYLLMISTIIGSVFWK